MKLKVKVKVNYKDTLKVNVNRMVKITVKKQALVKVQIKIKVLYDTQHVQKDTNQNKIVVWMFFLFYICFVLFQVDSNDLTQDTAELHSTSICFLMQNMSQQALNFPNHGFAYILGLSLVLFGFGLVKMTDLRPTMNFLAQV